MSDDACDASVCLLTRTQAAAQAVEGAREVVFCHPRLPDRRHAVDPGDGVAGHLRDFDRYDRVQVDLLQLHDRLA